MADAREVMNIRQASHYLGISPDTLYKYVSEDVIPAFKLGNRWKFKKSILDSWMEDKSLSGVARRPHKLAKPASISAAMTDSSKPSLTIENYQTTSGDPPASSFIQRGDFNLAGDSCANRGTSCFPSC